MLRLSRGISLGSPDNVTPAHSRSDNFTPPDQDQERRIFYRTTPLSAHVVIDSND
jgi:hypothetical protein